MSGKMQLIRADHLDVLLMGTQINFFKTVYRRHTNFAIESEQSSTQVVPIENSTKQYVDQIGYENGYYLLNQDTIRS